LYVKKGEIIKVEVLLSIRVLCTEKIVSPFVNSFNDTLLNISDYIGTSDFIIQLIMPWNECNNIVETIKAMYFS